MTALVTKHLPLVAGAPDGIKKLRALILELAVRGRLLPSARQPNSDVPVGWLQTKLGSILSFEYGDNLPAAKRSNTGEYPVYGSNGVVGTHNVSFVQHPCIVIGRKGSAGALNLCTSPGCCVTDVAYYCVPPQSMSLEYTFKLLHTLGLDNLGKGIKPGLNRNEAYALDVLVPPLSEQHRIVAKVDELMALCDRLEADQADAEAAHAQLVQALLDSLTQATDAADFRASWQRLSEHFHALFTTEASIDALKQTVSQLAVMGKLVKQDDADEGASVFLQRLDDARASHSADRSTAVRRRQPDSSEVADATFDTPRGWLWRSLGSILHITGGVTLGRKLADRKLISMPYLRVANVQRSYLVLDQIKEVEVPEDEVDKYKLAPGDLLVTEGGDWDKVGRTAIWRTELPVCLHQNHVFRARPLTDEFCSRWVELYLNASPARAYFAGSAKQTTNLASINMTQLRALAFPVPPLAEQHRIVGKVDELMALCDQLKAQLTEARQQHAQLASVLVEQAVA
jgi:type I restriction enzyme S subunit